MYLNLGYGTQSNARFSVAGVGADQGMDEQVERNAEHPEGLSDKRLLFITWFRSQALSVCFGVCVEQEETLALRKEGIGVILDSELPHLIGIDDDLLSTGIILYHLKVMNIRQCSSQYER